MDPKPKNYLSNYSVFSNSPVWKSDLKGDTDRIANYYYDYDAKKGIATQRFYSKSEKAQFALEWERNKVFMKTTSSKELLEEIEKSVETVWIEQGNSTFPSSYVRSKYENGKDKFSIRFNPRGGLLTSSGNRLSPATVLAHEMDHCVDDLKFPAAHKIQREMPGPPFANQEESRVTTGVEQKMAEELNEVPKGTCTREDSKGTIFRSQDFGSNKEVKTEGSGMPIGGPQER